MITQTKHTNFEEFVVDQIKFCESINMDKWRIYELLKTRISQFEIDYEQAIKIITEAVGV